MHLAETAAAQGLRLDMVNERRQIGLAFLLARKRNDQRRRPMAKLPCRLAELITKSVSL
jgi:hypothetical protein